MLDITKLKAITIQTVGCC